MRRRDGPDQFCQGETSVTKVIAQCVEQRLIGGRIRRSQIIHRLHQTASHQIGPHTVGHHLGKQMVVG